MAGEDRWLNARRKSALLWGLVGALSFGVLYHGYVLLGADWSGVVLLGGAALVGLVTTAAAFRLEYRLVRRLG